MKSVFPAILLGLGLSVSCGCGANRASFASLPASTPALTDNVVFLGDSITALWGNQPAFQAHSNWINKGIIGQGSAKIAMRFQTDVLALKPKTVHILAGTNDVFPAWELCKVVPGGATATTPPTQESLTYWNDTCANMIYMVETAKRNGIKVVLGTIPPWGCADDPVCGISTTDETSGRYDRITQLNSWLKAFAAVEHVEIIDYHSVLTNKEAMHYSDGLTVDGVHPDIKGFSLMESWVSVAVQ